MEITAHHRGWFEFRLAPVTSANGTTQDELDANVLFIEEAKSTRRVAILVSRKFLIVVPKNFVYDIV